jgi:hypothetical protein
VSFAAITLCAASQRGFIVVVYFVIDSVRKLLDTRSYMCVCIWEDNIKMVVEEIGCGRYSNGLA